MERHISDRQYMASQLIYPTALPFYPHGRGSVAKTTTSSFHLSYSFPPVSLPFSSFYSNSSFHSITHLSVEFVLFLCTDSSAHQIVGQVRSCFRFHPNLLFPPKCVPTVAQWDDLGILAPWNSGPRTPLDRSAWHYTMIN